MSKIKWLQHMDKTWVKIFWQFLKHLLRRIEKERLLRLKKLTTTLSTLLLNPKLAYNLKLRCWLRHLTSASRLIWPRFRTCTSRLLTETYNPNWPSPLWFTCRENNPILESLVQLKMWITLCSVLKLRWQNLKSPTREGVVSDRVKNITQSRSFCHPLTNRIK